VKRTELWGVRGGGGKTGNTDSAVVIRFKQSGQDDKEERSGGERKFSICVRSLGTVGLGETQMVGGLIYHP